MNKIARRMLQLLTLIIFNQLLLAVYKVVGESEVCLEAAALTVVIFICGSAVSCELKIMLLVSLQALLQSLAGLASRIDSIFGCEGVARWFPQD